MLWSRRREHVDLYLLQSTGDIRIRGLVLSDSSSIPIAYNRSGNYDNEYSLQLGFSLRDSPILPSEVAIPIRVPKPKSMNHLPKDLRPTTRRSTFFSAFSRSNDKSSEREEEEDRYRYGEFHFHHCCYGWIPGQSRYNRNMFETAEVITIWFDLTRPDGLHNAIYKVRVFCFVCVSLERPILIRTHTHSLF